MTLILELLNLQEARADNLAAKVKEAEQALSYFIKMYGDTAHGRTDAYANRLKQLKATVKSTKQELFAELNKDNAAAEIKAAAERGEQAKKDHDAMMEKHKQQHEAAEEYHSQPRPIRKNAFAELLDEADGKSVNEYITDIVKDITHDGKIPLSATILAHRLKMGVTTTYDLLHELGLTEIQNKLPRFNSNPASQAKLSQAEEDKAKRLADIEKEKADQKAARDKEDKELVAQAIKQHKKKNG